MACPDRNKDKKILAEIERRKQMQQQSAEREQQHEIMMFEDISLQELVWQVDAERVVSIERIPSGWEVRVDR